jgi:pyruvate formate lyase activating enzyme
MKTVPVNRILPVSMVDGPGNRTAIFLQACNISCAYCHNPETQKMCIHCGICVKHCPVGALTISEDGKVVWNEEICVSCDTCIKVCPHHASPKIKRMTAEEVFAEVRKNIPFIRGITVSGGECSLYPKFLQELFTLAKAENLSCLIDSNGTIDLSLFPDLLNLSDGVMLDVKSWDSETFKKLTGGDNRIVKKNLKYLETADKLEEIRVVCLPGEVDAEEVIRQMAITLDKPIIDTRLKLIKFRRFGVRGRLAGRQSPSNEYMEGLKKLAEENGFKNIVIT